MIELEKEGLSAPGSDLHEDGRKKRAAADIIAVELFCAATDVQRKQNKA